ncbi:uncharacterized protein LOC116417066 [Nasonia vitripennis]|uniref:DNA-directed DNA polymerase n=1 Tax=Nasonia vitripennis TaxID=7425 RepID=A0A7M7QDR5_NASVI|nr:uncharacterized protein LOC116417066 [Nasonia vitripennis]
MSAYDCKELVNIILEAYGLIAQSSRNVPEKVNKWVKLNNINLRHLRLLLQSAASAPEKQKFLSTIAFLKGFKDKLKCLLKRGEGVRERRSDRVKWQDLEIAFNNRMRSGVITNLKQLDIAAFMKDSTEYVITIADKEIKEIKYFNTKAEAIFQNTNLKQWFSLNVQQPIQRDMEEFQERDSGWTLRAILNLCVHINKYNALRGSSYVELPYTIKRKKACVNVKNFDDACFKWAILSALHPAKKHSDRVSSYKAYENDPIFRDLQYPVLPKHIPKFEKQSGISVNVYTLKKNGGAFKVVPTHLTSCKKETHINLLLAQNYYADEKEEVDDNLIVYHYAWIKDLSRLVSRQLSRQHVKLHICNQCLHYFRTKSQLQAHERDCSLLNKCRVNLPNTKNSILQFKNFNNKERVPLAVYADFECILKDIKVGNAYQQHEAFSIGYYMKCSYDDSLSYYRSYRGPNPAKWFVDELLQLAENIETVFWCPIPIETLTWEQEQSFQRATSCQICEKVLELDRVRDHCHLTGRYRGAAHEKCNLNYQDSRSVPVIFQNLTGYDSHFLIRDIAQCIPGRANLLPINKEKFISFTKHIDGSDINFKFIDSFRFMASSLDKLSSYLEDVNILKQEFNKDNQLTEEKYQLLRRKGVFPYDYVNSLEKLNVSELPPKDAFYNKLNNCHISDEDYKHAQNIWNKFNISNLGQYLDLYLKTDVLLLAEVFENFRTSCLKAYGLDPAHYYTTPGLTWDAMLKYTNIELELLTDIDKVMFIERGIRGGISQCCNG